MRLRYTNMAFHHITMATHHYVSIAFSSCRIKPLKHLRINPVIGIHKTDIFASCMFNASITRWPKSSILLMKSFYSMLTSSILVSNLTTTVRTSVINKQNLDIFKSLGKKAIDAFLQIRFDVINRNDNADSRMFHLSPRFIEPPFSKSAYIASFKRSI